MRACPELRYPDACVGVVHSKKFPDACVGVEDSLTLIYERTYIKESQQEFTIVSLGIPGKISEGSNQSGIGGDDKRNRNRNIGKI